MTSRHHFNLVYAIETKRRGWKGRRNEEEDTWGKTKRSFVVFCLSVRLSFLFSSLHRGQKKGCNSSKYPRYKAELKEGKWKE